MIVPESLWTPSFKDERSQLAPQRVLRRLLTTQALIEVQETAYVCPKDQVAFLLHAHLRGSTAGITTITRLRCLVADEGFSILGIVFDTLASSGGFTRDATQQGQPIVVLMAGEQLLFTTTFSAGAAGNAHEFSASLVLMPRGNWQLG